MVISLAKLTQKQQRFVEEYLIDLNATQAVIRAGYNVSDAKSASEIGSQLLKVTQVSKEISKAMAERSRRTGITQDRVLQELARIAFLNPSKVANPEDASVKKDATEDDLACIQSIKVKTSDGPKGMMNEREVRFHDKMKALELLGKHLGMFTEKIEVSGLAAEQSKLDELIRQMQGGEDSFE